MSTPIENLRAMLNSKPGDWIPFLSKDDLRAVLRDAERFKALERAHDGRSVYAMCIESHDKKARFTGYDLVECPLSELADRLREGGK